MLGLGHAPSQAIMSRASYRVGDPSCKARRSEQGVNCCNSSALPVLERDGAGISFLSELLLHLHVLPIKSSVVICSL